MAALLISYTIYTDSAFAVNSVTGQIFVAEIRPAALEFSLYSLAQSLLLLVCSLGFLFVQRRLSIRLETWLIIGLAMLLLIPIWGCIGLSNVNFGFKVSLSEPDIDVDRRCSHLAESMGVLCAALGLSDLGRFCECLVPCPVG